jgi:hypothetical protein
MGMSNKKNTVAGTPAGGGGRLAGQADVAAARFYGVRG